jgi:hypothetical protein
MRPLGSLASLEGAGPDRVGVASQEHGEGRLELLTELLLVGATDVPDHRLLVGADGALRELGDALGKLERPLKGLALGDHLGREADAKCLGGVEAGR